MIAGRLSGGVDSEGFASKVRKLSANGAEYESQGQARSASPLVPESNSPSPERA